MKTIFLLFTALLSVGALNAQTDCTDLFISEYVEGWDNNKAIELYNPTSEPVTLDNQYCLIRWANGSTTSDQDSLYVLPLEGTIGPYKTWVIIQDTVPAGQDTMVWPGLRAKADWLAPYDYNGTTPGGNVVFWNGDDAISLQKKQTDTTWIDIDIFGEIGVRPLNSQGGTNPVGAWTDTKPYWRGQGTFLTSEKSLIRKHTIKHGVNRATMIHYGDSTTGGYPNSFNTFLEHDSLPVNTFDSLGSHWCDCPLYLGSHEIASSENSQTITLFPNPSEEKIIIEFTGYSSVTASTIELLSSDGRLMKRQPVNGVVNQIDISSFPDGVYFARILMSDRVLVRKFLKQ
jgi:hypothetical protein